MSVKGLGVAVLCMLAAAAVAAPAAPAAWTPPDDLSAAGQNASTPQVDISAEGQAVFVWVRFDGTNPDPNPNVRCCNRIQARSSSGGVLGPIQTVSAAGQNANDPQVAVDQAGDAVIVFRRLDGAVDRITARTRSAAGVLGTTSTLSPAGGNTFEPQVAVDDGGDAVFSWTRFVNPNFQIATRALSSAGVLSGIQGLSQLGQNAFNSRLDVDADGDAVVTWRRFDGANMRAQTRARSSAGTLSSIENLSVGGQDVVIAPSGPRVAVDNGGGAVFAWARDDGSSATCCNRIQTRSRTSAGVMSPIADVSTAGRPADSPRLDLDAGGDALITYHRFDGANFRAVANERSAAGAISAPQTLSVAGASANEPVVAVAPAGGTVFAWIRPSVGGFGTVQSRTRAVGGALSPISDVSLTGAHASALDLALDPITGAMTTWQRSDGANIRIQASHGP
jgi:hypothetical protein